MIDKKDLNVVLQTYPDLLTSFFRKHVSLDVDKQFKIQMYHMKAEPERRIFHLLACGHYPIAIHYETLDPIGINPSFNKLRLHLWHVKDTKLYDVSLYNGNLINNNLFIVHDFWGKPLNHELVVIHESIFQEFMNYVDFNVEWIKYRINPK